MGDLVSFDNGMTIDTCIQQCYNIKALYGGLQAGRECFCADEGYDIYTKRDDSECSTLCAGNNQQTCGGDWRLQVHATGFNIEATPDSASTSKTPSTTSHQQTHSTDRGSSIEVTSDSKGTSKEPSTTSHQQPPSSGRGFRNEATPDSALTSKEPSTTSHQQPHSTDRGLNIEATPDAEVTSTEPSTNSHQQPPTDRGLLLSTTDSLIDEILPSTTDPRIMITIESQILNFLYRLGIDDLYAGEELATITEAVEEELVNRLMTSANRSITFNSSTFYARCEYVNVNGELNVVIQTTRQQTISTRINVTLANEEELIVVTSYVDPSVIAIGPEHVVDLYHSRNRNDDSKHVSSSFFMISGLLSVSLYSNTGEKIDTGVGVDYNIPVSSNYTNSSFKSGKRVSVVCAFVDISIGMWSDHGCELELSYGNMVQCACSHMTSFAVLMQVSEYEVPKTHETVLSLISMIGLAVSVGFLAITMVVYMMLRELWRSLRHSIHKNLVGNMLMFDVIFLAAIDRTENQTICKIVGISLHYEVLCVFMWMLAEAVYLVFKVIKKTPSVYNKLRYYIVACYVIPLFVVVPVAIARYDWYNTEEICWLNVTGRWTFVVIAMAILTFNVLILAKLVYILYRRSGTLNGSTQSQQNEHRQLRFAVRGSFMLLPILGVTWVLGPFAINSESIFIVYLFNILNSCQGFFIFIVYCLFDKEVRESSKKLRNRWKTLRQVDSTTSTVNVELQSKLSGASGTTKTQTTTTTTTEF